MKAVLSISGGGMRGIGPVRVLQEVERRTGRSVADIFSLVCGTSTGGIVACLAAAGVPMIRARDFYFEHGPTIFRSSLRKISSGGGMLGPRYESMDLASALSESIGATIMRDAKTLAMVTTVDDRGGADMVKSWDPEWQDCPLAVAALMTASAQTYFAPAKIVHDGEVQYFLDGGNVRNAPMACALAEALRLWYAAGEEILIVHLGTGQERDPRRLPHGGALEWAPRIFDAMTRADDSYDNYFCETFQEVLPSVRYVRFEFPLQNFPAMDDARRRTLEGIESAAWQGVLAEWPRFAALLENLK